MGICLRLSLCFRSRMELMKLTIELGTNLEKAAAEKEQLRQQISDVDQAVSQILGEMQKTAANINHIKCAHCNAMLSA